MSAARRVRTCGRRLVSVPLAVVVAAVAAGAVLVAVVTAPVTVLFGRPWRLLRFSAFLLVYACVDLVGVVAATWFWVSCCRSVRGRPKDERLQAHSYRMLAWLLDRLYRSAVRIFGLRVRVSPPVPSPQRASVTPLVVFARHAGPGDSFLMVHAILCLAGVRPQLVLKRFLRWDPCLDVLIGRTPHVLVPSGAAGRTTQDVAALGAGLSPGRAVVLFPECLTENRSRRVGADA